jgi:peptidoglycan/LPS O-acetylase OafA/YrhL
VFYFRRVCRIFPLYYVLVGSFSLLTAVSFSKDPSFWWLFRDPMPLWSYATFSQNIFMGMHGDEGANWLNMTWSLAVEEQFYLFIPFMIYFLPRRTLVCVLIIAVLTAPFLRWISPGLHAFVDTPPMATSNSSTCGHPKIPHLTRS